MQHEYEYEYEYAYEYAVCAADLAGATLLGTRLSTDNGHWHFRCRSRSLCLCLAQGTARMARLVSHTRIYSTVLYSCNSTRLHSTRSYVQTSRAERLQAEAEAAA